LAWAEKGQDRKSISLEIDPCKRTSLAADYLGVVKYRSLKRREGIG